MGQILKQSSFENLSLIVQPSSEGSNNSDQEHDMPFNNSEKPVESGEDNYEDESKELEALMNDSDLAYSEKQNAHSQKFLALFSNPFYSSINPPPEGFC